MQTKRLLTMLVACLPVLVGSPAAALQYRLHVLDSLPGHNYCVPRDINSSGQIVGFSSESQLSGNERAVMWTNLAVSDLGMGAGKYWVRMNDAGDVIADDRLWHNGTTQQLPRLNMNTFNRLCGINNRGQIVGQTYEQRFPSPIEHAALWDSQGLHDLGVLPGNSCSAAYDVNDSGQVVGVSDYNRGDRTAVMWQDGAITPLAKEAGYSGSAAFAINSLGWVAGYRFNDDPSTTYPPTDACLWRDGVLTVIPFANRSGYASDVNDLGQVVGYASREGGPNYAIEKAFVWQNGEFAWLEGFGREATAYAINNSGWIVGTARDLDNVWRPVAWEPVPEPSALLGLIVAITGMPLALRRKRS